MQLDLCLDPYLSSEELTHLGLLAESLGFRALWVPSGDDVRDPFSTFVELARASSTLRLGVMALSPFEMHPFRIATSVLSLNEISNGRMEIALGGGNDVAQTLGLQIERPVGHLAECCKIVTGMAASRPFSFDGEFYRIGRYDPPWVKAPAPSIQACAMGPQMVRMASRLADGVIFSDFTPSLVEERISWIRDVRDEHGLDRKFTTTTYLAVSLADDLNLARQRSRSLIYWRALWRDYVTDQFLNKEEQGILKQHMEDLFKLTLSNGAVSEVPGVPTDLLNCCVEHLTATTTFEQLDQVVDEIKAFRAAGIDRVMLAVDFEKERTIRALGEHVLPLFSCHAPQL